jgi:hypothetical protein
MLMVHGMMCLSHKDRNNLIGFARFIHIEIFLIYEPIINAGLPQLVSCVFRKGKKEDWLEFCAR